MPTNGQFAVGELVTASDANTLFVRGYRNRIINGAFVINQREYTSGTNLTSGSYGFDRWKSGYTNTSLTFTAGSQATTVTISASGVLQQIIERENIPAGTYILSWTGTATGRVYNSGGAAPSYAASPVQVTLDGTANVVVEFTASGGTKTLGLVQLEAGTAYSPFEYRLRGEELALCQRYYFRMTAGGEYAGFGMGWATGSTNVNCLYDLPRNFRITPTAIDTGGNHQAQQTSNNTFTITAFGLSASESSRFRALAGLTCSGLTAGQATFHRAANSTTAFIGFTAEL